MLTLRPTAHQGYSRSEDGVTLAPVGATVDTDTSDDGYVDLDIDDEDGKRVRLSLLPSEARALAATLVHFATEAGL